MDFENSAAKWADFLVFQAARFQMTHHSLCMQNIGKRGDQCMVIGKGNGMSTPLGFLSPFFLFESILNNMLYIPAGYYFRFRFINNMLQHLYCSLGYLINR